MTSSAFSPNAVALHLCIHVRLCGSCCWMRTWSHAVHFCVFIWSTVMTSVLNGHWASIVFCHLCTCTWYLWLIDRNHAKWPGVLQASLMCWWTIISHGIKFYWTMQLIAITVTYSSHATSATQSIDQTWRLQAWASWRKQWIALLVPRRKSTPLVDCHTGPCCAPHRTSTSWRYRCSSAPGCLQPSRKTRVINMYDMYINVLYLQVNTKAL